MFKLDELMELKAGEVKMWACVFHWQVSKLGTPTIKKLAEVSGYSYRSSLRLVHSLLKKRWVHRYRGGDRFVALRPRCDDETRGQYLVYTREFYQRYKLKPPPEHDSLSVDKGVDNSKNRSSLSHGGGTPRGSPVSHEALTNSGFTHISSVLAGLCDTGGAPIGIGNPSNPQIPKGIPDGGGALERMMMMDSDSLASYIEHLEDRELDQVIARGLSWGLKVGRWNRKQLAFGVIRAVQEHVKHPLSYALAVARSCRDVFAVGL